MLTSKNEHKVVFGLLQMPLFVFAAFFGIGDDDRNDLMGADTVYGPARKNTALAPNIGMSI